MKLTLPRRLAPELLDALAAEDPRALRSRDDLRRLHRAMATLSILQRALDRGIAGVRPRTLLELGAGDGSLMLRLAQQRARHWPGVLVTLLDRLNLVAPHTQAGLSRLGWPPRIVAADVFDWLDAAGEAHWDIVVAHLFMHHFADAQLQRLLRGIARRTRVFFCCEPRRGVMPLVGSHLVGLLGAGPVTRNDAVASVHAGFSGCELSRLWPDRQGWSLREYRAGLFSHCFLAVRKGR
jgi:hypothetical protein